MEWIQVVMAVLNGIIIILFLARELYWGKKFASAKDEIIRSREAEIETLEREIQGLREMTPMKVREYYLSATELLENYNNSLQEEANSLRSKLGDTELRLKELEASGSEANLRIEQLSRERDELFDKIGMIQARADRVRDIAVDARALEEMVRATSLASEINKQLESARLTVEAGGFNKRYEEKLEEVGKALRAIKTREDKSSERDKTDK